MGTIHGMQCLYLRKCLVSCYYPGQRQGKKIWELAFFSPSPVIPFESQTVDGSGSWV